MTTLRNAPITESVFDIRVAFDALPEVDHLEALHESIKDEYPIKEAIAVFQASFEVNKGQPKTGFTNEPNGFMFKTADGKRIVQARKDGYTFNKLKPYDNWESFGGEARKNWELFRKNAQPSTITRIALRYINRLELPLTLANLDEYFITGPRISPQIPRDLKGFFMRLELQHPREDMKAFLTIAKDNSPSAMAQYAIILDIDTFVQVNLPPDDNESVRERFEQLRVYKNEIFFNSITEKTLKLYQ